MIDIKITYGGRSYNSISDAIQKAMVDIPSNMKNMNVQLKNMPQELIDKIIKVLK